MDHVNFRLTENPFDYMGIDGAFGLFFISVFAIILCSTVPTRNVCREKGWLFEVSKHIPAVKNMVCHRSLLFTIKILAMFIKHPVLIMLQDGLTPVTMIFFTEAQSFYYSITKSNPSTNIHGEHGENVR